MGVARTGPKEEGDVPPSLAGLSCSIKVTPTRHFTQRFRERVGDRMPDVNPNDPFRVRGTLSEGRVGGFFLDVDGVARLVLKIVGNVSWGITVLPPVRGLFRIQRGSVSPPSPKDSPSTFHNKNTTAIPSGVTHA